MEKCSSSLLSVCYSVLSSALLSFFISLSTSRTKNAYSFESADVTKASHVVQIDEQQTNFIMMTKSQLGNEEYKERELAGLTF